MIRASAKIIEKKNPNWEKLKKNFSGKGAYVSIGIHEDAGSYSKGEISVVEVALFQEFGTTKIPERSFIRSTVDEHESSINAMREKMIENILTKGWSKEKALEAIGLYVQSLIQNKIKSNVPPPYGTGLKPNSEARIASLQEQKRKRVGHTSTLRESELLLRSVTFKVNVE
jgi:hypothetical protein